MLKQDLILQITDNIFIAYWKNQRLIKDELGGKIMTVCCIETENI